MATVIDALVVTLGLDNKELKKGVKEAQGQFSNLAKIAGAALAVVGGIGFFRNTIVNYVETADAVGKLSAALGINVEEFQAWGGAAVRAGGSVQGFQASVSNLNRAMQEYAMTGQGPAAQVLPRLGISAVSANGRLKNSITVLRQLATVMQGLGNAQAMAIGQKLGLDAGTVMLLQQGNQAIDKLLARQRELGVYNKRDAEAAAAYKNAQADLNQAWDSAAAIAMRFVVPALTLVSEGLLKMSIWARDNETFVYAFFIGLAALITGVLLPAMGRLAVTTLTAFAPFIAIAAVIALVAGLIAALVNDYLVWAEGGESVFGHIWERLDEMGPQLALLLENLEELGTALFKIGGALIGTGFDVFIGALETAVDLLVTMVAILGHLGDLLVGIFTGDMPKVMGALEGIGSEAWGFFDRLWQRIAALFTAAEKRLRGLLESLGLISPESSDPEQAALSRARAQAAQGAPLPFAILGKMIFDPGGREPSVAQSAQAAPELMAALASAQAVGAFSSSQSSTTVSVGEININGAASPEATGRAVLGKLDSVSNGQIAHNFDNGVDL